MTNTVEYYVSLLEDHRRIEAFARAIRSTVRPGDRVLEVGSGVGTYARFAARAGAAEVIALERDPVAIALSRELGLESTEGGRIRLIEGRAQDVSLPNWADVVIFEDWGGFGYHGEVRRLLDHVRERLSRPDTRFLPMEVALFLAPIDRKIRSLGEDDHGLPFSPEEILWLRKRSLNEPIWPAISAADLLAPGTGVGSFRPGEGLPERPVYAGSVQPTRAGTVTALAGWMVLHLTRAEVLDNGPMMPRTSWKPMILAFEEPLPVRVGEELRMEVEIAHAGGPGVQYWRWSATNGRESREGSNVNALPGDLLSLRQGSPDLVPSPRRLSRIVAEICSLVDGKLSVAQIARAVYRRNAEIVKSETEAVDLVLETLERLRGVL